jgi:hypothetical protein
MFVAVSALVRIDVVELPADPEAAKIAGGPRTLRQNAGRDEVRRCLRLFDWGLDLKAMQVFSGSGCTTEVGTDPDDRSLLRAMVGQVTDAGMATQGTPLRDGVPHRGAAGSPVGKVWMATMKKPERKPPKHRAELLDDRRLRQGERRRAERLPERAEASEWRKRIAAARGEEPPPMRVFAPGLGSAAMVDIGEAFAQFKIRKAHADGGKWPEGAPQSCTGCSPT